LGEGFKKSPYKQKRAEIQETVTRNTIALSKKEYCEGGRRGVGDLWDCRRRRNIGGRPRLWKHLWEVFHGKKKKEKGECRSRSRLGHFGRKLLGRRWERGVRENRLMSQKKG